MGAQGTKTPSQCSARTSGLGNPEVLLKMSPRTMKIAPQNSYSDEGLGINLYSWGLGSLRGNVASVTLQRGPLTEVCLDGTCMDYLGL